jgi:hypothetical protein
MKHTKKMILLVVLFATAMGFMETAIVVYLRKLYYPGGFSFPLKIIPPDIGLVECLREAATLVMLITIGIIAGKGKVERFAYFVLAFAVWDIFYYVFLFALLGWPQSLFTWDILFLLPVPWVGPVWAPLLLCALMVYGSVLVILREASGKFQPPLTWQWILMCSGAVVCIVSFMLDYLTFRDHYDAGEPGIFAGFSRYVPESFNTPVFFTGFLLMCYSLFYYQLKPTPNEKI